MDEIKLLGGPDEAGYVGHHKGLFITIQYNDHWDCQCWEWQVRPEKACHPFEIYGDEPTYEEAKKAMQAAIPKVKEQWVKASQEKRDEAIKNWNRWLDSA